MRKPCFGAILFLVAVMTVTVTGCKSHQDVQREKAQQILADVMSQDAMYAQYGLEVFGKSSSPYSEQLITEYLASVNPKTARAAAEAAASRRVPAHTEALKGVFSAKVGSPQIEAARALALLEDAEALQWLRDEAASDPINSRVLLALAEVGDHDTLRPILEKALGSSEQGERDQAYLILAEIDEPWSVDLVVAGLKKEHGEGREQAIRALGRTGDASHAPRIQGFVNTRGLVYATIEALGALGDESSIAVLEKSAERPEKLVKVYAATALWRLGKEDEATTILEPLLGDSETAIRFDLAQQLGAVSAEGAQGMLVYLAEEDADPRVRTEALRALHANARAAAVPTLKKCAGDADYQVAVVALDGLSMDGQAAAIEELEPLLESDNPYIVISAANAIIEILERTGGQPTS